MKNTILSIMIALLLGLTLVSAATADLEIVSVSSVSGNPGDKIDISVGVKNNGAESINVANIVSSSLTFGTNAIVAPSSASITSIGVGEIKSNTLSLTIPAIVAGGYTGTISVKDATDSTEPGNLQKKTYSITVNNFDNFEVLNLDETTSLDITAQEDEIRSATFQIKNTGSSTLTPEFSPINVADFSDGDKDISLSFSVSGSTIAPGATKAVTVTANIPNKIDIDTYEGIITVVGGSATDTFTLSIRVHPEVCKDGPVGDDLRLDVNEPDNGDDFAPGDTINIDVTVENDGNRKDVVVEAFLYNVDEDDEIERVEVDGTRISSDDEEDFEFDLDIPFDKDISEDDEYILFIKAYEDGDEDKHCVEEQIDIDIERESHDVRIERINLIPSSAKPGEFVEVSVTFNNVGSKDEDDVFVRLTSSELGWDETSNPVDLEDGESKDNDGVARFTGLLVPKDISAGTYSILAVVTFDDGDEESDEFATLTVLEGAVEEDDEPSDNALRLQSVTDIGNNLFRVSVVVVNEGSSSKIYELFVDAGWAEPISSQTFTVRGGDSRIVEVDVKAKDDTTTGSYSGFISLEQDGNLIDSESFNVAVTKEVEEDNSFAIGDFFSGTGGTVLFIMVDIVLVIIAIFFIRMIFKSNKRRPRVAEKVKL